jgi:hypothetical protein
LTHLKQLRGAGFAVETVAAHGAQPTASTYRTNYDLFTHTPDLFERAQLQGETTISVDFNQVGYLSDAGWRWRKHVNYVHGSKGEFTSLHKIQRLMICPDVALYINFPPHQWHPDPARMFYYRNRNRIGMWLLPKLHQARHQ